MKKCIIALFIVWPAFLLAQFESTVIDELELQFKVKQIDEFMKRFNYDITFNQQPPVSEEDTLAYRRNRLKNMLTLFNLKKYMNKEKEINDSILLFINYVIDNRYRLNYEDSTWCAELQCEGMYKGKKCMVNLSLHVERIKGVEYKWVIDGVEGSIFEITPKSDVDSLFISPAEHGIGFITLPDIINSNPSAIETLDYRGYIKDNLSVFNYLIASKSLKLVSVNSVVYHYKVGRYAFDVERMEKEGSYNKGWLINNLIIYE